jgi:anti-sigma B factor antagonist
MFPKIHFPCRNCHFLVVGAWWQDGKRHTESPVRAFAIAYWTFGWEYNLRMPLSANIENLPHGIAVVKLCGGLTLGTSLKIADSQVQAVIEDGISSMVIDLTDVEYVDSAGLGMLMYAYGMLNEKKGTLRLCGVTARVLSLLQMTKTDMLLPIDKSLDESIAALKG